MYILFKQVFNTSKLISNNVVQLDTMSSGRAQPCQDFRSWVVQSYRKELGILWQDLWSVTLFWQCCIVCTCT